MLSTEAELVGRARDLAPAIKARAAGTAAARKPADASIRDLEDAGIIQMLVPSRWGGQEAPLSAMMEVVEVISAACPSTGWIAAFYIGHNSYIAKFPERAQEEAYAARGHVLLPAASAPNMEARKVDGGWEVSGRAAWGSGIMHADWVMMSGKTGEGPRAFLMPATDVEVIDCWHFTGMAGTGSNDYQADKVFVPDHRTMLSAQIYGGRTEGSSIHANPLYSMPLLVLAYCTILPVLTGTLNGALEAFGEVMGRRVRNFSGTVVKEQQIAHITYGEQRIAAAAAGELARGVFRRVQHLMDTAGFTTADRIAAKGQTAFIARLCRDTVNAMMAASGASSFHEDQPLQRIWRDLNTVSTHAFWDWDTTREMTGRQYFGLSTEHPLV